MPTPFTRARTLPAVDNWLVRLFITASPEADPYLWLEDIEGKDAMTWVEEQNRRSLGQFEKDRRYKGSLETAERLLQDKNRIPYGTIRGSNVYNFWQDEDHIRGIWRRTTLDEYRKKEIKWDTVLDIDELAKAENENWVYKEAGCLAPDFERCLIALSRGGKDAVVVREFDTVAKRFVEGGFYLYEAKSNVEWLDRDHILVGTDFGEGSLTESGYPRIMKLWTRGTPLDSAMTILEVKKDDLDVDSFHSSRPEGRLTVILRGISFWETEYSLLQPDGKLARLEVPPDAALEEAYNGNLLFILRSPWSPRQMQREIKAGSLIAVDVSNINDGVHKGPGISVIWEPDERSTLNGVTASRDAIYVNVLSDVKGRILRFQRQDKEGCGVWVSHDIWPSQNGSVDISLATDFSDEVFLSYRDFLTPPQLFELDAKTDQLKLLKELTASFDAGGLVIEQKEATSKDGVRIPYFIVHKKDMKLDGNNPTILYGYGGFENSELPFYDKVMGNLWLSKGGVYVLANIRGGGEFGPNWHNAAIKENKQRSFDDFIAIAEDLIETKITSPRRLGIMGGSNGGLLVGAVFTQRPELFGAVVCQVPLLDMLRYSKLLAGASWMGEYGDPEDPKMCGVLESYSPYHNVKEGVNYPEVFFNTSTKDDRVHPGHARKMTAKMQAMGHKVFYFENTEGGHGAAANIKQRARREALEYIYLYQKLF